MTIASFRAFPAALLIAIASPVAAQDDVDRTEISADAGQTVVDRWQAQPTTVFDATEIDADALRWVLRPVVVFADTPNDPRFQQQMELLMTDIDQLVERDVILITDTDPDAESALRIQLRPRGYMMALLGKDGRVELRKPSPWSVRELSRSIDKMPMRQQEVEDRRALNQ